jgi:thiosulfate reductase cytochrome b subunit
MWVSYKFNFRSLLQNNLIQTMATLNFWHFFASFFFIIFLLYNIFAPSDL